MLVLSRMKLYGTALLQILVTLYFHTKLLLSVYVFTLLIPSSH